MQLRVFRVNGSPVMNGSSVGCEFYVTFLHAVMFGFYVYLQVLFTCLVIRFQLSFISVCLLVRGLAYLKQPSIVKGMSRSHLLFKACGTFSPEEKLFIYSCINYAGTYHPRTLKLGKVATCNRIQGEISPYSSTHSAPQQHAF